MLWFQWIKTDAFSHSYYLPICDSSPSISGIPLYFRGLAKGTLCYDSYVYGDGWFCDQLKVSQNFWIRNGCQGCSYAHLAKLLSTVVILLRWRPNGDINTP